MREREMSLPSLFELPNYCFSFARRGSGFSDLASHLGLQLLTTSKLAEFYGRQLPYSDSSAERQDALDTIYGATRIVKDPANRTVQGYRFYHFSDVNAAIRRECLGDHSLSRGSEGF